MSDFNGYSPEAISVLEEYKSKVFPVPVVAIAGSCGVGVFSDSTCPDNVNGHIELNATGSAEIIVNETHGPERKRFTIAHELAHFLMDMDYLNVHKSIDRDGDAADESYRAREIRANRFAAELLMPEAEFVRQWLQINDHKKVADYFGVSKIAARLRAINLGVLKAE